MMVDFPTLTELAEQIAPGDKNCARPALPRQRCLFPEMWKGSRHPQLVARLTQAKLAAEAIDPAVPRAQGTRAKEALERINTAP